VEIYHYYDHSNWREIEEVTKKLKSKNTVEGFATDRFARMSSVTYINYLKTGSCELKFDPRSYINSNYFTLT
jgi:hypothetical protein